MTGQANAAPTIIKRKKVVSGDGHHGGAWKVAYADFVTAMMAFFMMMWLLNATTDTQRRGLADYFSPTVPISRTSGGGEGVFSGSTMFADEAMAQTGVGASNPLPTDPNSSRGVTGDDASDDALVIDALRQVEEALAHLSGESPLSDAIYKHVLTRLTDEGLVVELFDTADGQLFVDGSNQATDLLIGILDVLQEASLVVTNAVSIEGHVAAQPVVRADNSVWQLSSSRADQTRALLKTSGMDPARIRRVTGYADREPVVENPMAVRNNRIEVIFLR